MGDVHGTAWSNMGICNATERRLGLVCRVECAYLRVSDEDSIFVNRPYIAELSVSVILTSISSLDVNFSGIFGEGGLWRRR